jgi:hypothetical protein
LAAREYLGWVPHSYEDVVEAATAAGLARVEAVDSTASEDDKRSLIMPIWSSIQMSTK